MYLFFSVKNNYHLKKFKNFVIYSSSKISNVFLQMKTVSVALVLCLNVGVDPPDIVKTQPCARLECWIGKIYLKELN